MSDARAAEMRLEIRKTIHAPREAVFKAWTTPDSIKRWFSSPEAPVRDVAIEPKAGGRLVIACDYRGGVWKLDGRITECVAPRRLAFTWVSDDIPADVGSLVTVDLEERDGRTELVLRQTGFPTAAKRGENEGGWNELLGHLATETGDAPGALRAVVRKVIAATPEALYNAWVSPELAAKFLGYDGRDTRMTADVRVGGRYHLDMHGGNDKYYPHDGVYLVVDPPRRLVFTWESAYSPATLRSTVSLTFTPVEGGTEVLLVHERHVDEESRKGHEDGWDGYVDQLATLVASA